MKWLSLFPVFAVCCLSSCAIYSEPSETDVQASKEAWAKYNALSTSKEYEDWQQRSKHQRGAAREEMKKESIYIEVHEAREDWLEKAQKAKSIDEQKFDEAHKHDQSAYRPHYPLQ